MNLVRATLGALRKGVKSWAALEGDCMDHLRAVPDNSFDMVLTSPPYENRRKYGAVNFTLKGEAWVAWMVDVCRELARVCKGLIVVNCQGYTENYRYSSTPLLLGADLHRAGFILRTPGIYYRNGISGSGGPDWLRNDYEYCLAFSRMQGKLPWSNNLACGGPPRYGPGGPMSHRTKSGKRVNEWGGTPQSSNGRDRHGTAKKQAQKNKHYYKQGTPRRPNGARQLQDYTPPKIANPGTIIKDLYTAEDVAYLLAAAGVKGYGDVLHCLVGGGLMGDKHAHGSHAPMALNLADFWIRSFCPPGGLVYDPFGGLGTTAKGAVLAGRKCLLSELQPEQIALTEQRLAGCSEMLFTELVNSLARFDEAKLQPVRVWEFVARRILEENYGHNKPIDFVHHARLQGAHPSARDPVPGPSGTGANGAPPSRPRPRRRKAKATR